MKLRRSFVAIGCAALLAVVAAHAARPRPAMAASVADAIPTLSPLQVLMKIRTTFLSHRPPPPFETYTLVRAQNTNYGDPPYPDLANSYKYHVWVRNLDRAALARKVYMSFHRGTLEFQRPALNEDRDPGPPTADLFEPAPATPHPVSWVPTPEPTNPPGLTVIATVKALGEFDYRIVSLDHEDGMVHLVLSPIRNPNRNRLRQIWADETTYELKKVVATDRLFVEKGPVYPVLFTITLDELDGYPVVTHIHGVVYGGYDGDGQTVDYDFKDITFPKSLPSWYFDPRDYAQHQNDAPL